MSPDPDRDLEARLRSALRPAAPSREWSQRLLERLPAAQAPTRAARTWLPLGWAASVLLIAGLWGLKSYEHREQGLAARRQVIDALRVTNQKLDLAYRAVRDESQT
jgi:hypothetical protein